MDGLLVRFADFFSFRGPTADKRDDEDEEGAEAKAAAGGALAEGGGAADAKSNTMGGNQQSKHEKERKIGHRRVGEGGEITYKKIQTSQIMGSIQLGIQHTVRNGSDIHCEQRKVITKMT